MVFIVHGAISLVNDQIKTVAEGVLRVCIPYTRMMNKNYQPKNFENFITFVLGRFLFPGWNKGFGGRAVSYPNKVRGKAPKAIAFS